MSEHRRRIDKVLDPSCLADLPEWPLDELRRHAASMDIAWRRGREHLIADETLATLPNAPAPPGDRPRGRRGGRPAQGRSGVTAPRE